MADPYWNRQQAFNVSATQMAQTNVDARFNPYLERVPGILQGQHMESMTPHRNATAAPDGQPIRSVQPGGNETAIQPSDFAMSTMMEPTNVQMHRHIQPTFNGNPYWMDEGTIPRGQFINTAPSPTAIQQVRFASPAMVARNHFNHRPAMPPMQHNVNATEMVQLRQPIYVTSPGPFGVTQHGNLNPAVPPGANATGVHMQAMPTSRPPQTKIFGRCKSVPRRGENATGNPRKHARIDAPQGQIYHGQQIIETTAGTHTGQPNPNLARVGPEQINREDHIARGPVAYLRGQANMDMPQFRMVRGNANIQPINNKLESCSATKSGRDHPIIKSFPMGTGQLNPTQYHTNTQFKQHTSIQEDLPEIILCSSGRICVRQPLVATRTNGGAEQPTSVAKAKAPSHRHTETESQQCTSIIPAGTTTPNVPNQSVGIPSMSHYGNGPTVDKMPNGMGITSFEHPHIHPQTGMPESLPNMMMMPLENSAGLHINSRTLCQGIGPHNQNVRPDRIIAPLLENILNSPVNAIIPRMQLEDPNYNITTDASSQAPSTQQHSLIPAQAMYNKNKAADILPFSAMRIGVAHPRKMTQKEKYITAVTTASMAVNQLNPALQVTANNIQQWNREHRRLTASPSAPKAANQSNPAIGDSRKKIEQWLGEQKCMAVNISSSMTTNQCNPALQASGNSVNQWNCKPSHVSPNPSAPMVANQFNPTLEGSRKKVEQWNCESTQIATNQPNPALQARKKVVQWNCDQRSMAESHSAQTTASQLHPAIHEKKNVKQMLREARCTTPNTSATIATNQRNPTIQASENSVNQWNGEPRLMVAPPPVPMAANQPNPALQAKKKGEQWNNCEPRCTSANTLAPVTARSSARMVANQVNPVFQASGNTSFQWKCDLRCLVARPSSSTAENHAIQAGGNNAEQRNGEVLAREISPQKEESSRQVADRGLNKISNPSYCLLQPDGKTYQYFPRVPPNSPLQQRSSRQNSNGMEMVKTNFSLPQDESWKKCDKNHPPNVTLPSSCQIRQIPSLSKEDTRRGASNNQMEVTREGDSNKQVQEETAESNTAIKPEETADNASIGLHKSIRAKSQSQAKYSKSRSWMGVLFEYVTKYNNHDVGNRCSSSSRHQNPDAVDPDFIRFKEIAKRLPDDIEHQIRHVKC